MSQEKLIQLNTEEVLNKSILIKSRWRMNKKNKLKIVQKMEKFSKKMGKTNKKKLKIKQSHKFKN